MECCEAIGFVALYTRANITLTTDIAQELPSGSFNIFHANYRLKEDSVGKVHFRYPYGAYHVRPLVRLIGLLECAKVLLIRTQATFDALRRTLYALATQPLAFGYVWHAIAFLMHSQIAHVTEQYGIAVHTLAIKTYATDGVLVVDRLIQCGIQ